MTTCPICERRKGKRLCPGLPRSRWAGKPEPGKSETICAQCCGEQREVTIDCPADCPYLAAAHRYEAEREKPRGAMPFPEVEIDREFLEEHQPLLAALSVTLAREHAGLRDGDALAALDALAKTYQTLDSGLYYEHTPESPTAQATAAALKATLEQLERELHERGGPSLRPGEALGALVFLRRLAQVHGNGRPLSRRFLDFLREKFPAEALGPAGAEGPRIIVPGR